MDRPCTMTRASWLTMGAAALVMLAVGCQQSPPPDTRDADLQALRQTDAAWAKVAAANDLEGMLAFYAADASLLMPNEPVSSGRDAIRKVFGGLYAMKGFSLNWQATKADVARNGDLGYTMGTYQMTLPGPKGKTVTDKGKYVTVWKRQADGSWKAVADMANTDLPAPTTP